MKKKHPKGRRRNKAKARRNAGPVAATTSRPRSWRPRMPRRGEPPPWQTIAAAVGGSVGSAVVSGLISSQKIAEPDTMAMLMAVGGATAAYFTEGNVRVAATGIAAAGAGQYALAKMYDAAVKKAERDAKKQAEQNAQTPAPAQVPQLPAPAVPEVPPRKSANGGGVVIDLFRDAAADLEQLDEDEYRYGFRDNGSEDDEPSEIDLDQAA
jgi:hypothetical protein